MSQEISLYAKYTSFVYAPPGLAYIVWYAIYLVTVPSCCNKSSFNKPVSTIWSGLIKFTFIGGLSCERIGSTKERYLFFKHPVKPWFVRALIPLTTLIWLAGFVAFWNTFLIRDSFICDDTYDCFYWNQSIFQVDDCRSINTQNNSVLCYRLQLDLISAVAKAGGIQGLMITFMYGFITVHMWLRKKIIRIPVNKKGKWKCFAAFLILFPLLLEAAASVTLVGMTVTRFSEYGKYILTAIVLSAFAFITALFPIWLHCVKKRELEFDTISISSASDTDESDAEDVWNHLEHKELLKSKV